jgi:hypothetical protein
MNSIKSELTNLILRLSNGNRILSLICTIGIISGSLVVVYRVGKEIGKLIYNINH